MTTDSRLLTPDAHHTANRLPDALRRERVADATAVTDPSVPGLSETDANAALIERAKGALMLFYGVDSYQAFAVLVGWSRMTRTPVDTIAHALLRGICEGNPQTQVRQRPLIRWLEAQLRDGDPAHGQLPNGTGPSRNGT